MSNDAIKKNGNKNLSFVLFNIDLIAKHYKREVLRVMWACLDKELVSPTVKRFKRLCTVNVVHKDTTVCSTVERYTQGLEAFLSRRIPKLLFKAHDQASSLDKTNDYLPAS